MIGFLVILVVVYIVWLVQLDLKSQIGMYEYTILQMLHSEIKDLNDEIKINASIDEEYIEISSNDVVKRIEYIESFETFLRSKEQWSSIHESLEVCFSIGQDGIKIIHAEDVISLEHKLAEHLKLINTNGESLIYQSPNISNGFRPLNNGYSTYKYLRNNRLVE